MACIYGLETDVMTTIIKSGNILAMGAIRDILAVNGMVNELPQPPANSELMEMRRQVDALKRQLDDKETELQKARSENIASFKKGETAGHQAGLQEANDRAEEKLRLLEAGILSAVEKFEDELGELERLAALMARECLEQILGNAEKRSDFLCQIIRHQIGKVSSSSRFSIEVSSTDFRSVSSSFSADNLPLPPNADLRISDDLHAGECRIKFALGTMSVGVGQQWSRIRSVLTELVEQE